MGKVEYKVRKDGSIDDIHTAVIWRCTGFFVTERDAREYAYNRFRDWSDTDAGKFIDKHAIGDLKIHVNESLRNYTCEFVVSAKILGKHLTEFYLRWGQP